MKDDSLNRAVNWFELDRLVDGQLNRAEYRELLRQIEKDPDGWRQCALAFLQHQALQQELQALATDPNHPFANVVPAEVVEQAVDRQAVEQPVVEPAIRRTMIRSAKVLGGVAATLLIGVTLGVAVRPNLPDPLMPNNGSAIADSGLPTNSVASPGEIPGETEELGVVMTPATESQLNNAVFDSSVPPKISPRFSDISYEDNRDGPVADDPYLGGGCRKKIENDRRRHR